MKIGRENFRCKPGFVLLLVVAGFGAAACASETSPRAATPSSSASTAAPATVGPSFSRRAGEEACPVTVAGERREEPPAGAIEWAAESHDRLFGGGGLWVLLPEFKAERGPDGLLRMKIPWWRGNEGHLEVQARSLDSGARVEHEVSHGYGLRGFQPTAIEFTHQGCWRVTGVLGPTEVGFVVDVRS